MTRGHLAHGYQWEFNPGSLGTSSSASAAHDVYPDDVITVKQMLHHEHVNTANNYGKLASEDQTSCAGGRHNMPPPHASSVGSNCLRSTCIPNLKSVTLTVCKIWSVAEFGNWATSPGHAHLGGISCPQSVIMQNLNRIALALTKIWHISF